jgi:hypothetical protein
MPKERLRSKEEEVLVNDGIYRRMGIKRHMTVRIPRGVAEAIEDFLRTEQAVRMGFDSKADVVTAAIRNLLAEYGYYGIPQKKETIAK